MIARRPVPRAPLPSAESRTIPLPLPEPEPPAPPAPTAEATLDDYRKAFGYQPEAVVLATRPDPWLVESAFRVLARDQGALGLAPDAKAECEAALATLRRHHQPRSGR